MPQRGRELGLIGAPVSLEAGAITRLRSWFKPSLESPLLSLPAVSLIVIGVFAPITVLAIYSLWPTVDQQIIQEWTLANYVKFFTVKVYWRVLLESVLFAGLASALTVVIAFPAAYFVATKVNPRARPIWAAFAVLQFFTSYLLRVFVWMNLLGESGILNQTLVSYGLVSEPLWLLGLNKAGIIITFIYLLVPLAFLSIYIALERANPSFSEAAADLGARPWQCLLYVIVPVARTGILGAFVIGIITILGDYVTPQLIGGTDGYLYSNLIQLQFGSSLQWGLGSALALILMVVVFVLLLGLRWLTGGTPQVGALSRTFTAKRSPFLLCYMVAFMAFLYAPIILMTLLAFNASPNIGFPITGLTFHWFANVYRDPLLVESIKNSALVGGLAVSISLVVGTVAAVQLARTTGYWRHASLIIISVPVFLPPMLLGLAIIIGLNALGVDRGIWTIIAGHTLLCLPIVTLLVLIRLEGLDPNFELAAMDLGASPVRAFLLISVPQALPGIIAAALIGLALSLDEFILTSLVTGADSTLPLYIFGQLRFGITPSILAISVIFLALSILLLAAGAMISRIGQRKDSGEALSAILGS